MNEDLNQEQLNDLRTEKLADIYNQAIELNKMSVVIDKYCEYCSNSEPIYNLCVMTNALVKAADKISLCINQLIEMDKEPNTLPFDNEEEKD